MLYKSSDLRNIEISSYDSTDLIPQIKKSNKKQFTSISNDILNDPQSYMISLHEILSSSDEQAIITELNKFYNETQKKCFPFFIEFGSSPLPITFINTLVASPFKRAIILILKIIFNLTRDDNYSGVFLNVPDISQSLLQVFQLHYQTNPDIISLLLLIMTRFIIFSKEYRDSSFIYLSSLTTYFQNCTNSSIKKNILHYFLILVSTYELSPEQFSQFRKKFRLLYDSFNDETTPLATSILYHLSKYEKFITFFQKSQFPSFLAKNLTSTNREIILPTLHIYSRLYEYFQYDEEPDIWTIANCLASKHIDVIRKASPLLVFLLEQFSQSLQEETAYKITRMLIDLIINGEDIARCWRLQCLLTLFNQHHELLSEIATEDLILSIAQFLESDNDLLVKQTIILLNTVFQEELLIDSERPLYYAFIDNEGLDTIKSLENSENPEVAQFSSLFLKL